jgi:hypothetical protein
MQPNLSTAVTAEQPPNPIKACKGPDCTKKLQSNNESGYCELHNHIGRRRPRPTCNRPGCTKKLQSNNTIGFCRQHRGDAKLVPQVCKRVGCSTRLTIRSKTGYCELHKSDANTSKPKLSEEELKERRADDRYELRHDETATVACRICGKRMERLGPKGRDRGHLFREHGLTVPQYHQHCQSRGWGTPPTTSLRNEEAIAKWRRDHPEKIKALQTRRLAKRKLLRRTDPKFVKHEGDLIRKRAQAKLSDADKQVRVRCEVPDPSSGLPCGEWYRGLGKHLWSVHHMSVPAYNILRPGAPTQAPDLVGQGSTVGQINKRWWAEQKRKMALAWRPDDWDHWKGGERLVAEMLIKDPDLQNPEIGVRLDELNFPCPYGSKNSWEREITKPGGAAMWIKRVRGRLEAAQATRKGPSSDSGVLTI